MLASINVVTLPQTCFAAVLPEYICHETELTLNKIVYDPEQWPIFKGKLINESTEKIVNDEKKTLYVNLDVRKNLLVDAKLLSGKVQAKTCDYLIFSYHDVENYKLQTVKNILALNSKFYHNTQYSNAKSLLENALDFDLISEDDYVQMTYKHVQRTSWKESTSAWNIGPNHNINHVEEVNGMLIQANKKVIDLKEVLKYSDNRSISIPEVNKIKMLLGSVESEKIALTLMNTINPTDSFVELLCLTNQMDENIRRRNPNIPVLPLLKGAYNIGIYNRTSDFIVKEYELNFGYANNEVLERIADNYYHPNLEQSSKFDFKLKVKK
jgi:hypothetical protein